MILYHHLRQTLKTPFILMTAGMIGILLATHARAMRVIEQDKLFVYFPPNEAQLAERLVAAYGPMTAFLKTRGLPVSTPLHIVLDEELDEPGIRVKILPHREIRIPIRAPGVMENGYTEADPWSYFLFMGLSAHGIYQQRSAIPKAAYYLMGELISPNVILELISPNVILPDWGVDGIGFLLYEEYQQRPVSQPLAEAIFKTIPIPELDLVSHHPDIWPGRFMYRIYGRPFIRWLHDRWGWEKILTILKRHGAGILPLEIDSEAYRAFGMSWGELWRRFQDDHNIEAARDSNGLPIIGFWPAPEVYWDENGIYQGLKSDRRLGHYGYSSDTGDIWLSGYDKKGVSTLLRYHNNTYEPATPPHFWDPGPGGVAVTRIGSRPYLSIRSKGFETDAKSHAQKEPPEVGLIAAPPDVIQLSGPVMDEAGRVVVAANLGGNWDIWLYDGGWYRLTDAPSVELDPWLADNSLVFASNASGRFQIHSQEMEQLTQVTTQALLPRGDTYLELKRNGWLPRELKKAPPIVPFVLPEQDIITTHPKVPGDTTKGRPYSIWPSIKTNYIVPDIFLDGNDFQLGFATTAYDITREYAWDAGIRYAWKDDQFSWRLGASAKNFSAGISRYSLSYKTQRTNPVDELRWDFKIAWTPPKFEFLELSANYRRYWPYQDSDLLQEEGWAAVTASHHIAALRSKFHLEYFTNESISFSGSLFYRMDWPQLAANLRLQFGKTWGELIAGHNTFRIGGNTGEGIFTRRTQRLYPVRGFDADILDADQAFTAGMELHYPLANLQAGYKTLPLFIRNIVLVAFVDTGLASEDIRNDEILVSIGLEAITAMELAWILDSEMRIGLAWPVVHPVDLRQKGPTFLIQVGYPL